MALPECYRIRSPRISEQLRGDVRRVRYLAGLRGVHWRSMRDLDWLKTHVAPDCPEMMEILLRIMI